jgi:hypothetical protein
VCAQKSKTLTPYKKETKTFSERYVDVVFDRDREMPATEMFAKAETIGDYTPDFVEAQHWAAETLQKTDLVPVDSSAELDLIEEIFCLHFVPYDQGEISLKKAKKAAVARAEEFFSGTVVQRMFDEPPDALEWHALHIYRLGDQVAAIMDKYFDKRKKLESHIKDMDDFYLSTNENEREEERPTPIVSALNLGVKIGFLYRDAWWKMNHEKAAIKYYEQAEGRKKGSPKGGASTANRYAKLKKDCLAYFSQAYQERGTAILGAPISVVAHTIRKIAMHERPDDFVGPKGEPLSQRWFTEVLEDFQADGEFGKIIEATLNKA